VTATVLLVSGVLLFANMVVSGAQQDRPGPAPLPAFGNKALSGKIGDLPVHVVLDHYKGELSGSYYYDTAARPSVRNWMTDLQLHGRVDARGQFELLEETGPADKAAFKKTGVLKGAVQRTAGTANNSPALLTLAGTWTSADGKRTLPFTVIERGLPPGSPFRLETRTIKQAIKHKGHSVNVNAAYPQLAGGSEGQVAGFNKGVLAAVSQPVKLFKDLVQENAGSADETSDDSGDCSIDIAYEITFASERVVSVLFRERTWNAFLLTHDSYEHFAFNYDLQQGRRIAFSELFRPQSGHARTLASLWSRLIQDTVWQGATLESPLSDKFSNWVMDERGLTLNIAMDRASGGVVEMFLPHASLTPMADANGPLAASMKARSR
jgi:hypothetical protein